MIFYKTRKKPPTGKLVIPNVLPPPKPSTSEKSKLGRWRWQLRKR